MKKPVIVTIIAAYLILCAAVWSQGIPTEEGVAAPMPLAVTATRFEVLEEPKIEELIIREEEKAEIPSSEIGYDIISEPDPSPDTVPTATETQVIAEPEPVPEKVPMDSKVQPTPEPEPTPTPTPSQTVIDPQPSDVVYVPGFGWLECQGSGEVIHDENIYENGNKIGTMGRSPSVAMPKQRRRNWSAVASVPFFVMTISFPVTRANWPSARAAVL